MVAINKINNEELREIVQRTLLYLDTHHIRSRDDFEKRLNITSLEGREGVLLEIRPSTGGSQAHTLSYVKHGRGIPLEVRFNYALLYAKIILKLDQVVEGYTPFMEDSFGNIVQERIILSPDISSAYSALEELATNLE